MQLAAAQEGMPERTDLLGKGQVMLGDLPLDNGAAAIQQHAQVKGVVQHLHRAGFHLAHIQHVIDERQQVCCRAAHLFQAVGNALLVVEVALGNVDHTHNAVDGRADIVRHIGQKFRFGAAGFLRLVQRLLNAGAGVAVTDDQQPAADQQHHADGCQHDQRGVLVKQTYYRKFQLPQIGVVIGDGKDLAAGQAVNALV